MSFSLGERINRYMIKVQYTDSSSETEVPLLRLYLQKQDSPEYEECL